MMLKTQGAAVNAAPCVFFIFLWENLVKAHSAAPAEETEAVKLFCLLPVASEPLPDWLQMFLIVTVGVAREILPEWVSAIRPGRGIQVLV